MAWAKGTATDWMDMLRKFRDFVTGDLDPAVHVDFDDGVAITGAKATGTLTFSGNAANTETVTIGARTYTFESVLTAGNGHVKIGATAADTALNLIAAIMLSGTPGTEYGAGTVRHQQVNAVTGGSGIVTITAIMSGESGNDIETTDTLASASFGAAALAGGSGDAWSVLPLGASMTAIPSSGFATDGELYLAGPGSDPTDQIVVGLKTYRSAGVNVFGLELRGFTGYNSALAWDTQPGVSSSCYSAWDDAAITCWFWANARRIMCAARIGTTDVLIHLGLLQQFGTRNQYPYPLYIAGSAISNAVNFQTNDFGHSCLPDPCSGGSYLRWVDGTWQQYRNYTTASSDRNTARITTGNVVWPQRNPTTPAEHTSQGLGGTSEDRIFEQFTTGSTLVISPNEISAYPLFPVVLCDGSSLVGRVDGLFCVYGQGLVKGDTVTDSEESPPAVYDCFGNTWRSEPVDFFAVRRE